MGYLHLDDPHFRCLHHHAKIAVHAIEGDHMLDAASPESFGSASRVSDAIVQHGPSRGIGDGAGLAFNPAILSTDTVAAHAVMVLQQFEHAWEVGRIVLQIAVQHEQIIPSSTPHSGDNRRRLAIISAKMQGTKPPIFCPYAIEYFLRSIGAAVIDEKAFELVGRAFVEHGLDALDKGLDVLRFVV